jgi:hypothetical protein
VQSQGRPSEALQRIGVAYMECLSVSQGRQSEALQHIGVAYIGCVCVCVCG